MRGIHLAIEVREVGFLHLSVASFGAPPHKLLAYKGFWAVSMHCNEWLGD